MEARCRRARVSGRPPLRILPENLVRAEGLRHSSFVCQFGLILDRFDEVDDRRAILGGTEISPARQLVEDDVLASGEIPISHGFSSPPGIELLGSVVPGAAKVSPLSQCSSAVDAGPVERAMNETFFAGLGEDVAEASHQGRLLVADLDGPVSTTPELLAPAVEAAGLLGEVGFEVLHEAGELVRSIESREEVEMVGEEGSCVDVNVISPLGATENADQNIVELSSGA
jgi:hypothetical protein